MDNGDKAWSLLIGRIKGLESQAFRLESKVDRLTLAVLGLLISVIAGLVTAFVKG